MSNHSFEVNGGAGAGFHGKIIISETNDYTFTSGKGGYSIYSGSGGTGENGVSSTISMENEILLSVGGGSGGSCTNRGGYGGSGGKITTNNLNVQETFVNASGANGNVAGKGGAAYAPNGPISGHTWGKAGNSYTHYSGGSVAPGYHGYIMIKYLGPLP